MTASRRPYNHRIREARFLDQRPVGPFDGLLVACGLQVREGEGKLDQMTERIERAQARHVLQRLDGCVVAACEAIHIGPGEPRLRAVRVQGYAALDQVRAHLRLAGQIGEAPSDHPQNIRVIRRVGHHAPRQTHRFISWRPLTARLGVPPAETEQ